LNGKKKETTMTTEFIGLDCVNLPPDNHLNLYRVSFVKDGRDGKWLLVSRRKKPLVGLAMDRGEPVPSDELQPDVVQIVAVVKGTGQMLVTKEYRVPLANYEYACPAGKIDSGESAEDAAARELLEETGYRIVEVKLATPILFSSAGMTDESVVTVIAIVEKDPGGANPQDFEEIEVVLLDQRDAARLCSASSIFKGAYISAKSWPFIYMWAMQPNLIAAAKG
jgi:ADP-ribose pyrophosphatase